MIQARSESTVLFSYPKMKEHREMIHVICGPPCAGKSTYIQERAKPGELVIDFDKIAEAIGSGVRHQAKGYVWKAAQVARSTLIDYALRSKGEAWIIDSLPGIESLARYESCKAYITVLDPGIAVCKERAANRPEGTKESIDRWYARASGDFFEFLKYWPERRKTTDRGGGDPRDQSVAEKGRAMKRTDITAIFPDATDEQIKAMMDLNGSDVNREKGKTEEAKKQLADAQAAIEELKQAAPDPEALAKATKRVADLEAELSGVKAAEQLRVLRESISAETGVPAHLLRGDTEEALKEHAQQIQEYHRPSTYPAVRDGGEVTRVSKPSTRDQFSEWLNESLK
jgi:predicted kinase